MFKQIFSWFKSLFTGGLAGVVEQFIAANPGLILAVLRTEGVVLPSVTPQGAAFIELATDLLKKQGWDGTLPSLLKIIAEARAKGLNTSAMALQDYVVANPDKVLDVLRAAKAIPDGTTSVAQIQALPLLQNYLTTKGWDGSLLTIQDYLKK
jgi:hypothetical protein